ncbi:hypothetical protein IscW_ISCW023086 [Ixodes scapularis]|uniref:Uncharacterized protein n=1 Tax=Ixodes scapularis TaxID=6945 RepID=B7QLZ8_IXOSC|nr:hypothetical protein IscW_ISCW023086 [Ixodes scapularis]|eukprot:XP_002416203.1 hypothetical protein IscW_ISCW023086 [Ixodes scapularis]
MLLAPSEIHFLHDSASSYILTPDVIDDVGHQLLQQSNERVPRIQVVEKDGSWFALNDSYLRVYRELERQGRCPKIRVEVVALSKVPQNVQKGMIVGEEKSEDVSAPVRSRRAVANRQQTTKAAPSEIHFLHDSASSYILTPDVIDDVGHQLLQQSNERVPRIQVVEKDGSWFALNDSYLRVYRELERQGRCPKIRVEVVALSKVPQNVQKGMIVGEEKSEDVSAPVRSRRAVANRQQTTKAGKARFFQ